MPGPPSAPPRLLVHWASNGRPGSVPSICWLVHRRRLRSAPCAEAVLFRTRHLRCRTTTDYSSTRPHRWSCHAPPSRESSANNGHFVSGTRQERLVLARLRSQFQHVPSLTRRVDGGFLALRLHWPILIQRLKPYNIFPCLSGSDHSRRSILGCALALRGRTAFMNCSRSTRRSGCTI